MDTNTGEMVTEKEFRARYYAERRSVRKPWECRMCGTTDLLIRSKSNSGCCRPCVGQLWQAKRAAHPLRIRIMQFRAGLKKRFNITPHDWMVIWRRQHGGCAICGKPGGTELHIDHDHACCPGAYSCGKCVRGLLCRRHNHGLGNFQDNLVEMRAAIDYVVQHRNKE